MTSDDERSVVDDDESDEASEPSPRDPEFLREHRRALLAVQDLRAEAFAAPVLGGSTVRDLIVAIVFGGGKVSLPPRILKQLVPGVRYRIHAAGTDEVAVDVAVDEEEEARKRGAYR